MTRKSEAVSTDIKEDVTPAAPVEQIVTLKLKQRAYWRGDLCEAGITIDYPKAEADNILQNTELFSAA